MAFDFQEHLSKSTPHQQWNVFPFTGGVVNFTVRATKIPPNHLGEDGRGAYFPDHNSIILKYAPPCIAAIGPRAPMDQNRQETDAQALELLRCRLFHEFSKKLGISFPTLLYHDLESHVLMISDLNPSQTLSQYLFSLPKDVPRGSAGKVSDVGLPPQSMDAMASFGDRLGTFLAHMHAPEMRSSVLKTEFPIPFAQSPKSARVIASTLSTHLTMFEPLGLPTPSVTISQLVDRVEIHHRLGGAWNEIAFTNGDLTPGAILVNPSTFEAETTSYTSDPSSAAPSPSLIRMVDWEFASMVGKPLSGDFSQLLAILHLHLIATEPGSEAFQAIVQITDSLKAAYCRVYMHDRPEWLEWVRDMKNGFPRPPRILSTIATILCDTFLTHGQEMVNNAIWEDWPCACCDGVRKEKNGLSQQEKRSCKLIKEMVEAGAWYLCKAGQDLQAFLQAETWEATWKEETFLKSLFRSSE